MKKTLILSFLLDMAFQSFSQNTKNPITKEDYLAKRKKQQKIGLIMLIGGPVVAVVGFSIGYSSDANSFGSYLGTPLFFAGAAATIASIPV
jgi:hypothetical protein